jgi:hypothetical protein
MPASLPFTAVPDKYNDTATIGPSDQIKSITFTITTNNVFAQIAKKSFSGKVAWDEYEVPFPPGSGGFSDKIYGIRFRNATSGMVANVTATAYYADDSIPFSSPFAQATSTPGGSGVQFDLSPQPATFLEYETTGVGPSGFGQNYIDSGGGGIQRTVNGNGNQGLIDVVNGLGNAGINRTVNNNGNIRDTVNGGGIYQTITTDNNPGYNLVVGGNSNSGINQSLSGTGNTGIIRSLSGDNNSGMQDTIGGLNNIGSKLTITDNFNGGRIIRISGTSNGGYNLFVFGASNSGVVIGTDGTGFGVQIAATGDLLGFYGKGPVAQAAHPTTLAQVITAGQNLGLWA